MSAKIMLNIAFRAEKLGIVVASASNAILLYMLFCKANTSFGPYRHLMICYTIIEMAYSLMSMATGMAAHSTDTAYVVFQLYSGRVNRSIAPAFLVDFCGIYFSLLLILVVHFIYRYFVVCDFKKLEFFHGWYLSLWIIIPLLFGYSMALLKFLIFGENEYLTNELREPFLTNYNLTMEQVLYNGPNYYICDKSGNCEKPMAVWITMGYMTFALFFSIGIMLYCGQCTYRKLLENCEHSSVRTNELQTQLMTALIVQSVIPIIFMYIPILFLFLSPMFGVSFGPYVNLVMGSLAIYPPVDQFAILYVIKDFRNTIARFFWKSSAISKISGSTLTLTT